MEDCKIYEELISAYVDGEISPQDSARLQEHLAGCENCRELLAVMSAVHEQACEMQEKPPKELVSRVMNSINGEKKGKFISFSRFKFTIAAAMIALVMYAVAGPLDSLFPQTAEDNPDSEQSVQIARSMPEPASVMEKSPENAANTRSVPAATAEMAADSALPYIPYEETFAFCIVADSAQAMRLFNGYSVEEYPSGYYIPFDKLEREAVVSAFDKASEKYVLHEGDDSAYRALMIFPK